MDALGCLSASVRDLDGDAAVEAARRAMGDGAEALAVVRSAERGLRIVGARYAECVYFLSGLIMAGDIFRRVMSVVLPDLVAQLAREASGRVLVGTVKGDVHDLGKWVLVEVLRGSGFTVLDLGFDVPPERFVTEGSRFRPDVVALSGPTTAALDGMRETVDALAAAAAGGRRVPVIVGGAVRDEAAARYVGADLWTCDLVEGLRMCRSVVGR